ncbi:MAG: RDD family protein [Chloroflexota bacterium]
MLDALKPVEEALRDGYPELARNLLRVLIADYPDNPDVWYWAAQAAVNTSQQKAFLQKAVALDPLHHQAANALHALEQGQVLTLEPDPVSNDEANLESDSTADANIRYAKLWRRTIASLLDALLTFGVPTVIATIVLSIFIPDALPQLSSTPATADTPDVRVTAIVFGLIVPTRLIYHAFFLTRNNGQTLGKAMMQVRVVKRDGTPITIWEAILRDVIGYEIVIRSAGLSFAWGFFNPDRRAWHDYIVNTIVVDAD